MRDEHWGTLTVETCWHCFCCCFCSSLILPPPPSYSLSLSACPESVLDPSLDRTKTELPSRIHSLRIMDQIYVGVSGFELYYCFNSIMISLVCQSSSQFLGCHDLCQVEYNSDYLRPGSAKSHAHHMYPRKPLHTARCHVIAVSSTRGSDA